VAPHDAAAAQIVLVKITPEDLANPEIFGGRRPLDPAVLRRAIDQVATHQPAVIAIDIDTAPPAFLALRSLPAQPPVVWARAGRHDGTITQVSPVLGYSSVEAEGHRPAAGVAIALEDGGTVRSYARRLETPFGAMPTFTCAILEQCPHGSPCGAPLRDDGQAACRDAEPDREWLIDYRAKSQRAWQETAISIGALLGATQQPSQDVGARFRGKVVVIGGTFPESGDIDHPTLLGSHTGIELLGQVLATELRGGGANPGGTIVTSLLVAFETYVILLALATRTWIRRFRAALAVIVGIAIVASLVNEYDLSRAPHYAVVLLCFLPIQGALRYVEHSQEMLLDWWHQRGRRR
jgi:CHASE2 domain-containing sensor protein